MDDDDFSPLPRKGASTTRPVVNPDWADAIQRAMHDSILAPFDAPADANARKSYSPLSMSSGSSMGGGASPPRRRSRSRSRSASSAGSTPAPLSRWPPSPPTARHTPTPPRAAHAHASRPEKAREHKRGSHHHAKKPATSYARKHHGDMEREEKLELVGKLQYYVTERGFRPFRDLTADDPVEDLRYEVFRASREQDKRRNIKLMQRGLVTASTILEMVHHRWNPLGLRLEGYSKSMLLTIHDFDDIFEELHWKYCDNFAMPVEMKLFLSVVSSVYFFHMSGSAPSPAPPASAAAAVPAPVPAMATATATAVPPPATTGQPRMSGPRVVPSSGAAAPPAPSMDILAGLGMVQQLMGNIHR